MHHRAALTLRVAVPADAGALLAIYAPYVEGSSVSFEYELPTPEAFAVRIAATVPEYPYLVCICQGQIAGYAYAHRAFERAAYDWNAELSVYVSRAFARLGVGRALYEAVLALLARQGVLRAYAVLSAPNEPSEAFHRAMGFTKCATFADAGYKLGAWHDTLWYVRVLGAPAVPPRPVTPFARLERAEVNAALSTFSQPCAQ